MVRNRRDEISPERQIAACIAECERHGWRHEIFTDAEGHRSGRTEAGRPAWQRLKAQLNRRDVVAVVVNSLDRSSRSPKDFFNFLDELQHRQIELVSVTEQFDTSTAIGRAFLAILMVVASLESDLASERTSATIAYRHTLGLHWGNNPYGYDRNDEGVLVANEDAPVVVLLCELYATGSFSYESLAVELNGRGHRFRDRLGRRRPWARPHVRSVLSNILIYLGYVPEGRGKDRRIEEIPGLTLVDAMIENSNAIPGQHEAIIAVDLAERCLRIRQGRNRLQAGQEKRVHLLTGIAHCAHCGVPLRGQPSRRQKGSYVYRHHWRHGSSCEVAAGHAVDAASLEEAALGLLEGITLPPELEAGIREQARSRLASTPGYDEAKAALDRLATKLKRLRLLYVEGDLPLDEYHRERDAVRSQMIAWQQRLGSGPYDVEAVLANVGKLAALIRRGSRSQQRQVIGLLFERIDVDLITGEIKKARPREWFELLLHDLGKVVGDTVCPQGSLVALCVANCLDCNLQSNYTTKPDNSPLSRA